MKAFPGLSCMRIDRLCGTEAQSLELLATGAHFTSIALVGFECITDEQIFHMHWAFYRQQERGKAEPLVKVYLSQRVQAPRLGIVQELGCPLVCAHFLAF